MKFGVIHGYESVTKKQESSDRMANERYNILRKGKRIYTSLSEEEYFNVMEDLSIEYYQTGPPKKSRQGAGNGTKYAASSRNVAKKKYRGQGKG